MRSRVGGSLGGPALCHVLCRRVKRDYSKRPVWEEYRVWWGWMPAVLLSTEAISVQARSVVIESLYTPRSNADSRFLHYSRRSQRNNRSCHLSDSRPCNWSRVPQKPVRHRYRAEFPC